DRGLNRAAAIGSLEDNLVVVADDDDCPGKLLRDDTAIHQGADRCEVGSSGIILWDGKVVSMVRRPDLCAGGCCMEGEEKQQRSCGENPDFRLAAKDEACDSADAEGRCRADEDVPGPGDDGNGDQSKTNRMRIQPEQQIE